MVLMLHVPLTVYPSTASSDIVKKNHSALNMTEYTQFVYRVRCREIIGTKNVIYKFSILPLSIYLSACGTWLNQIHFRKLWVNSLNGFECPFVLRRVFFIWFCRWRGIAFEASLSGAELSRERNGCFSPFGATKFQFVMGFNGYYINRMFSTCECHFGPTSTSIKYDLYLKAQRSQASLVLRQFWRLWLLQAAYIYYTFRFSYFRISLPNECLSWWGGPAMVHDLLIVKLPFMALNFQTKTNSRNRH